MYSICVFNYINIYDIFNIFICCEESSFVRSELILRQYILITLTVNEMPYQKSNTYIKALRELTLLNNVSDSSIKLDMEPILRLYCLDMSIDKFISLCRDPSVSRFYPRISIDPNNPISLYEFIFGLRRGTYIFYNYTLEETLK